MARRKTGDKKIEGKNIRPANVEENLSTVQADNNSIAIGGISIGRDLSGNLTIGYTANQVSDILTKISSKYQLKPFDGRCPYKGLEVFEEEDADLFFGRERLVNELVGRVKESRTVFITGPSGSGKSSLVRAGLIHALKQGKIKSSERWLYETMKPGREPIKDLALAFSRLKSPELQDYFLAHIGETDILNKCAESVLSSRKDQCFVLFIDQFEEVFTQINPEEERIAFINMLAHAGTVENGRVIVLFAMRSDFVSNCATYPALNELLSQQFRQIGAMQPEELVSAIALPAKHVGLQVENELIAQIINDMKGEPGALPLMQFALKDLFDAQQEKGGVIALRLEDYLRHGGIHKSLERHADKSFTHLNESEQQLARSIFSGLIEIGRGTSDTRRTALFDELIPANAKAQDVGMVVQKLADARLIITDEQAGKDTVTISHEKLIDAWPWLRKLVNENRDVIALQNEIASDAKEWDEHRRDPSYLYTGARLVNAHEQLEAKRLVLSDLAHVFVATGIELEQMRRDKEEKRRQKELDDARKLAEIEKQRAKEQTRSTVKLRWFTCFLSIAFIGALIAVAVAVFFGNQSQKQTRLAVTNEALASEKELAARESANAAETAQANAEEQTHITQANQHAALAIAKMQRQLDLSILLGVEAFHELDNFQTRGALLDIVQTSPRLRRFLNGHQNNVYSVAFSPDGRLLASGGVNGTISLWDVESGLPIGSPLEGHAGYINSVVFSPDGKILASASGDNTIILWDVETYKPLGVLLGHNASVTTIAFSPDGKFLASGSEDTIIVLWDVAKHQPTNAVFTGHSGTVWSVSFSPDGKTLASGSADATIILWDVETRRQIGQSFQGHRQDVLSVAFSPDGKTIASGGRDRTIILWDVESHQTIGQPLVKHTNYVNSIDFNSDGTILASGSGDTDVILWDVATHQAIDEPFEGHSDWVKSVAFSPDGNTLASGSQDSTIILWNTKKQSPISQSLEGHTDLVFSVAFSPDGKKVASGSRDKTVIFWDVETRQPIGLPLNGHQLGVTSVAFSPNGKTLASGSYDKSIILWDVDTKQPIGQPLKGHEGTVWSLAYGPDGKTLVSGSEDNNIIVWDSDTGQRIGQPLQGHNGWVSNLAFSPDGKKLASASGGGGDIILWDMETHQMIGAPIEGLYSVAFSPDGKIMAYGNAENDIMLLDMATYLTIGQPLEGHTSFVNSIVFSPDGKIIASGANDNKVILWDVETHQPIGQPLEEHTDYVKSVAFSPDGKTLVTGSNDATVILWDVDVQYWIDKLCDRVGRNFTPIEWTQYFPKEEYRKTCEKLPKHSSIYQEFANEMLLNSRGQQQFQKLLDAVKHEMDMDSAIKDPASESSKLVGKILISEILGGINSNRWQEVIDLIEQVKANHLPLDGFLNNLYYLNRLCWNGSLDGYAVQVLEYCERAVDLTQNIPYVRDSRGLARALTGDYSGAIEDFQFFVENYPDQASVQQRQQWIIDLKVGKNPFTPELLEQLKDQ